MTSDRIMPVVRNWIAGFFIAIATVATPLLAIYSERVKSPYQGQLPQSHGTEKTNTKRAFPVMDVGSYL
jgi:hypothetical protein